ncbi:hypothetical protein RB195_000789 [Necator americanus]
MAAEYYMRYFQVASSDVTAIMTTLRGCKARLTSAVNSNYPSVFRSDAHPALQLAALQRRIEDMENNKTSIEIVLETFQWGHEHASSS